MERAATSLRHGRAQRPAVPLRHDLGGRFVIVPIRSDGDPVGSREAGPPEPPHATSV